MQKKIYYLLFLSFGLLACNSNDRGNPSGTSDSDIDAARNFIQAALVGDFQRAKIFMIDDSLNHEDLNAIQRLNERLTSEEKEKYQAASIRIHQNRKINDSTSVIYYSNSYRNKTDSLKVIKANGQWLVDFKYIFHKTDSLP
jgi:plasmid maintenance system killer protein